MHASEYAFVLIRHFEGFQSKPYLCPGGYWTIGYGHLLSAKEVPHYNAGIDAELAEQWLIEDVGVARHYVQRLVDVSLSQHQQDALISFTFNLGGGALERSTLRRKLNRHEYRTASDEFMRWVWAGGRKLPGLVRRRMAERMLFLGSPVAFSIH